MTRFFRWAPVLAALAVVCAISAPPASAQATFPYFTCMPSVTQALTGTDPTTAADGIATNEAEGVFFVVSAESSRTLSGAGSMLCWYQGAASVSAAQVHTYRWMRCPTALDVSLVGIASSQRDYPSGEFRSLAGGNLARITWVPSGVTVSAGTTVSVTLCTRRRK